MFQKTGFLLGPASSILCFVLIVGIDKPEKEPFKSGEQEPWVHRGGLLAEFRVSNLGSLRSWDHGFIGVDFWPNSG